MKIHHLNCATLCPFGRYFVNGIGSWTERGEMICHCLLIETSEGLVLIDTGFGTGDVSNPKQLGMAFRAICNPILRLEETALYQIRQLGFAPEDVRHIILTHLHLDHAGGISDFPHAKIHVFDTEYQRALQPKGLKDKGAYLAPHWKHQPKWALHETDGEKWNGFERIRAIKELGDEILIIPLVGHSAGHCGIAVKADSGWILHCGDAYFHHTEMQIPSACPLGLRFFQEMMQHNRADRLYNQQRLRELASTRSDVRLFCSHDKTELQTFITLTSA